MSKKNFLLNSQSHNQVTWLFSGTEVAALGEKSSFCNLTCAIWVSENAENEISFPPLLDKKTLTK